MTIITKRRFQHRKMDFPTNYFIRKNTITNMRDDSWDASKPTRPIHAARAGEVGPTGSSYSRHPEDPTDDGIDVKEIERLIEERIAAKRVRDFNRADSIRSQLKFDSQVVLNDKDRTWSTNSANVGPIRPMRNPPVDGWGGIGHSYTLHRLAGPSISTLTEDAIHQLIAERVKCRLDRDFDRADEIQRQLVDAHVQLDDRKKLWRSDGVRFSPEGYDYEYAPEAGPIKSSMPEEDIKELLRERFARKISHNFDGADAIEFELIDAGVDLIDKERLWRADGEKFPSQRKRKDDD